VEHHTTNEVDVLNQELAQTKLQISDLTKSLSDLETMNHENVQRMRSEYEARLEELTKQSSLERYEVIHETKSRLSSENGSQLVTHHTVEQIQVKNFALYPQNESFVSLKSLLIFIICKKR
jgi:ATP-dependent protease HslVU (ClpYQ) ATPase subunit